MSPSYLSLPAQRGGWTREARPDGRGFATRYPTRLLAVARSHPPPSGGGMSLSFDRLRVDRAPRSAGDDQRRAAEEELVDLVLRAILGELLEIENLAHAEAHRRDHHPVPRLVRVLGFVRAHLAAPGVGDDRGDLVLMAPVAVLELHARRVPARVAAPVVLR